MTPTWNLHCVVPGTLGQTRGSSASQAVSRTLLWAFPMEKGRGLGEKVCTFSKKHHQGMRSYLMVRRLGAADVDIQH